MSCSRLGRVRERCAWLVQAGHPQRQYRTVGTELIGERVEGGGPGCVSHLTNIKKKKKNADTYITRSFLRCLESGRRRWQLETSVFKATGSGLCGTRWESRWCQS